LSLAIAKFDHGDWPGREWLDVRAEFDGIPDPAAGFTGASLVSASPLSVA
jgi:hypothetical protein